MDVLGYFFSEEITDTEKESENAGQHLLKQLIAWQPEGELRKPSNGCHIRVSTAISHWIPLSSSEAHTTLWKTLPLQKVL